MAGVQCLVVAGYGAARVEPGLLQTSIVRITLELGSSFWKLMG
jgi:hypothetical protein